MIGLFLIKRHNVQSKRLYSLANRFLRHACIAKLGDNFGQVDCADDSTKEGFSHDVGTLFSVQKCQQC
ncbi:MAG: hypothetical protein Q8Q07_08455 [Dehalococcoidales bacterium]|nr:hypothetical protein [Dehalococcoidales bacterium]